MRGKLSFVAAAAALSMAAPAEAKWFKAESSHFVIYAEKPAEELKAFAMQLERFDSAVRVARNMEDVPPGPNNRVTVYVLPSVGHLQSLIRAPGSGIAGLYIPRASGSISFVPDDTKAIKSSSFTPQSVFFHEYSHHLMLQSLDQVLPQWLVEGFAEFYSTAKFEPDGSVGFGIAPAHRGWGINLLEGLPLKNMLAGNFVRTGNAQELIYGQGWLLTHMLAFNRQRSGQITQYIQGITAGTDPMDAAKSAFGDLEKLQRELNQYRQRKTLDYVLVAADKVKVAEVKVTALGEGEAMAMPLRMQTRYGVEKKDAPKYAALSQKVAAAFPNEAAVWVQVAEAELDADNAEAAKAAADKALAIQSDNVEALMFAGMAESKLAEKEPKKADWAKIRGYFLKANRIDPDDPEPLVRFYQTFLDEGVAPNKNAVDGLYFAATLVPQDNELRLIVARQLLRDSASAAAQRQLAPLAFNLHAGKLYRQLDKAVDLIKAGDREGAIKALDSLIDKKDA